MLALTEKYAQFVDTISKHQAVYNKNVSEQGIFRTLI